MKCEQIYDTELKRWDPWTESRRYEFLELMSWNLYSPTIDWELFWSFYYNSELSAETALELSAK